MDFSIGFSPSIEGIQEIGFLLPFPLVQLHQTELLEANSGVHQNVKDITKNVS